MDKTVRRTLLAFMLLFTMHVCFTQVLRAADLRNAIDQVDPLSPTKDPGSGSDLCADPGLLAPPGIRLHAPLWLDAPARSQARDDEGGALSLLPVTGLQPQAP
ncbi:MAG: hypothetical protein QM724_05385 [Flavobacteriales bacterium]